MAGEICHVEINSTDLEATREFTSELFGWEFTEMQPSYWLFAAGEGCGGGVSKVEEPVGKGDIRFYITVDSIEETLEDAGPLGGTVDTPKTEIGGGYGFYALLRDPGGTVYGLWQTA